MIITFSFLRILELMYKGVIMAPAVCIAELFQVVLHLFSMTSIHMIIKNFHKKKLFSNICFIVNKKVADHEIDFHT